MASVAENEIDQILTKQASQIIKISEYIFTHPELGDTEYSCSAFLADMLQKNGFTIQYPYCAIPTAFRAEYGNGNGPRIAFLAEYDALPGYGTEKKPAHACGHNWIAASSVGAALALSQFKTGYNGTVVVIGTPAEETVGRKVDLVQCGAFNDIDAVFQMHLNRDTNLNVFALAIDPWQFEFFGKASHAAAAPENGINALDAVNLTFAGISALRQQLRPDVRIHGIVTAGGDAPNIIPAYAACRFYVRSLKRDYLDEVSERVKNCARGAALMTGTEVKITKFENSFDDLVENEVLKKVLYKNLKSAGIDSFSDQLETTGSTDIGNVSYTVPTIYGEMGVGNGKAGVHEEAFLEYVDSEEAHIKLIKVVKGFALSAIELFSNDQLLKNAWKELKK